MDEAPPTPTEVHFSWIHTRMSTERTLMSWNRTSLSLITFGFTIYQFFQHFQEVTVGPNAVDPEAPRNLGLTLIIIGTLGTLLALGHYVQMVRYLRGAEFKAIGLRPGLPHPGLTFLVALLSALIGIFTTVWMLARG